MRYLCDKVFERVPEVTGLRSLKRKGDKWEGPYRIDGTTHSRPDKLKVYRFRERIWLFEEGAGVIGLVDWMLKYGGVADMREVDRLLEGEGRYFAPSRESVGGVAARYVTEAEFGGMARFRNENNPLFRYLTRWYVMRDVWQKYQVCTDGWGNTVYWYRDMAGHLCHDKRMLYKEDGHRDKSRGAWSKYRISEGYTAKCLFGEHLLGEDRDVCVVESEKTAMLLYAWTGKVCLATGGKSNIRLIRRVLDKGYRVTLYPDRDAIKDWESFGKVCHWWEDVEPDVVLDDNADIGDYIALKRNLMV